MKSRSRWSKTLPHQWVSHSPTPTYPGESRVSTSVYTPMVEGPSLGGPEIHTDFNDLERLDRCPEHHYIKLTESRVGVCKAYTTLRRWVRALFHSRSKKA